MSGAFRSSLCSIVPVSSCSLSGLLLLCILIVGIHASGISIPLSLFSAGNNFSSLTGHVSFQISHFGQTSYQFDRTLISIID